jgi:hypothetical protein
MDCGKVVLDGEPSEVLSSEEARLIGVGIPKVIRLYQMLKADGVKLSGKIPLSPEEMAKKVREALRVHD